MTHHNGLLVETVTNGPFMENCFVVGDEATRKAIVLDPGGEEDRVLEAVRRLDLDVQEIVNTHAHIDHVGAVAVLKRVLGVPFAIHPEEEVWLAGLPQQSAVFGLSAPEVPAVDRHLAHDQPIRIGQVTGTVLHTPGHSAGGCCLLFAAHKVVLVGDTLFAGSVGRTDLPGGSTATLLASIRDHLLVLDDDVVVYSGHGPATTIGTERRSNPFLQPGGLDGLA